MKSTPTPKPRPAVRRRAGASTVGAGEQDLAGGRLLAALVLVCAAAAIALQPAIVLVAGLEGALRWTPGVANLAIYVLAGRLLLTLLLMSTVLTAGENPSEESR